MTSKSEKIASSAAGKETKKQSSNSKKETTMAPSPDEIQQTESSMDPGQTYLTVFRELNIFVLEFITEYDSKNQFVSMHAQVWREDTPAQPLSEIVTTLDKNWPINAEPVMLAFNADQATILSEDYPDGKAFYGSFYLARFTDPWTKEIRVGVYDFAMAGKEPLVDQLLGHITNVPQELPQVEIISSTRPY